MKNISIHTKTSEETICNKIIVHGFEYYVSNEVSDHNEWCYYSKDIEFPIKYQRGEYLTNGFRSPKVIATNNPNINIPKIVDKSAEIITDDVVFVIDLPNYI